MSMDESRLRKDRSFDEDDLNYFNKLSNEDSVEDPYEEDVGRYSVIL